MFGPNEWAFPPEDVKGMAIYADWMRPQRLRQGLSAHIFAEEEVVHSSLTLWSRESPEIGTQPLGLIEILMPHLQRAWQLHRRIGGLERERDEAEEVLGRLAFGIVLVDGRGRVCFVNPAAAEILDQNDGLSIRNRSLCAALAGETVALRGLITGAARTGSGRGLHSGGALTVSRPSLRRGFSVLVAPLKARDDGLTRHATAAVVFLSDPESELETPGELLRRLYRLTRAESTVCALFLQGKSLRRIAEELEVSVHAVRGHVKHILAKTGATRQADLMRLLLGSPAGLRLKD